MSLSDVASIVAQSSAASSRSVHSAAAIRKPASNTKACSLPGFVFFPQSPFFKDPKSYRRASYGQHCPVFNPQTGIWKVKVNDHPNGHVLYASEDPTWLALPNAHPPEPDIPLPVRRKFQGALPFSETLSRMEADPHINSRQIEGLKEWQEKPLCECIPVAAGIGQDRRWTTPISFRSGCHESL